MYLLSTCWYVRHLDLAQAHDVATPQTWTTNKAWSAHVDDENGCHNATPCDAVDLLAGLKRDVCHLVLRVNSFALCLLLPRV